LAEEANQSTLIHSLSNELDKEEVAMGEANPPPIRHTLAHFGWRTNRGKI